MADIATLQSAIASETFDAVPQGDWDEVVVSFLSAGRLAESRCRLVRSNGTTISIKTPANAVWAYANLREAMATAVRGAWFSSSMTLDRQGRFRFAFDYLNEPSWGVQPTDEALLEDLAAHQRPASLIPAWHPAYRPEQRPDIGELQITIARESYRAAPAGGWHTIVLSYRCAGGVGEADSVAVSADGEQSRIVTPNAAILAYRDLRRIMANAKHGAWFTSTMTVCRDGEFTFGFDYRSQPRWTFRPDDAALRDDLAKYPRPESEIPAWHPGHPARVSG